MSLFATLGQGDVWSISGITFANAIGDILDKEDFTLEELLQEDELLQEVKSRNGRLIEFLSREETVDKLVDFVMTKCEDDADDLRKFKYPYISCEVFCCEVPDILHVLVEYQDNKFLKKLLSLLDCESPLDAHLAGYFEKILEMLFRRMTVPVLAYVNAGGIPLMQRFLKQIDNYSIMQVVQRLMLPHIPFSMANDIDEIPVEERHNYQCNWSYLPEACDMLCVRMLDTENAEVPSHVSDLLITVLQLSPPDAMILSHLCKPECLEKIFSSAFVNFSDAQSAIESPTPQSSVSLAALSVLESLISRLCEALGPSVEETSSDGLASEENQLFRQLREAVANVCSALVPYLPSICSQLKRYTEESPCGSIMTQAKVLQPRLGHRGLLTVKFVESVVRLGNVSVDRQLCESGVLRASVDLVFTFEFNSLLHLTVQRIVLMIVEGGPSRRQIQRAFLSDGSFLQNVMRKLGEVSETTGSNTSVSPAGFYAGCRSPLLGHLIQISQAIVGTLVSEESIFEEDISSVSNGSGQGAEVVGMESNSSEDNKELPLRSLMSECGLLSRWEEFVNQSLRTILDVQTNSNLSGDRSSEDGFLNSISGTFDPMGLGGESSQQQSVWRHRQFNLENDQDEEDEEEDDDDDDHREVGQHHYHRPVPTSAEIPADFADFVGDSSAFSKGFDNFELPSFPGENKGIEVGEFADFGSLTFQFPSAAASSPASSSPPNSSALLNFEDFAEFGSVNIDQATAPDQFS